MAKVDDAIIATIVSYVGDDKTLRSFQCASTFWKRKIIVHPFRFQPECHRCKSKYRWPITSNALHCVSKGCMIRGLHPTVRYTTEDGHPICCYACLFHEMT